MASVATDNHYYVDRRRAGAHRGVQHGGAVLAGAFGLSARIQRMYDVDGRRTSRVWIFNTYEPWVPSTGTGPCIARSTGCSRRTSWRRVRGNGRRTRKMRTKTP